MRQSPQVLTQFMIGLILIAKRPTHLQYRDPKVWKQLATMIETVIKKFLHWNLEEKRQACTFLPEDSLKR